MRKTRLAVKAFTGAIATAVLIVGATAGPAQAKDTGWNSTGKDSPIVSFRDTGWN